MLDSLSLISKLRYILSCFAVCLCPREVQSVILDVFAYCSLVLLNNSVKSVYKTNERTSLLKLVLEFMSVISYFLC